MKKFIVISFALLALASCGGSDSKEGKDGKKAESTEEKKEGSSELSNNPDYQKGLALVVDAKNGCLTCHRVDEPLTGPPYRDVANKYAGTSDTVENYLVNKIITGGSGVWGQVPMIPHPSLSEADARAMAKYILLLKK